MKHLGELRTATASLTASNDRLEKQLRAEGRISSPPGPIAAPPELRAEDLPDLESKVLKNRMALSMLEFSGLTPSGVRELFRLAKRGAAR